MAKEIERKFKVDGDGWRDEVSKSYLIEQAYLVAERERSVRVRIRTLLTDDGSATPECFLTMKFGATAISTDEYEYAIPYEDARSLVSHAGELTLSKIRHLVEFEGRTWEIDVFQGRHDGLIVAEIECDDAESINNFPAWLGTEVTYDSYFKNASLVFAK
ncbi:CYTH domain-containing protein [Pararhizobium sp. BT-229]|uniref:CYTH domain-containing protein n=1 Tax=Pararhizobium sp. BT-229 TaxID=2986923 RepID=UPI0021F78B60|nr:CYTH domain-containing protein [Pararhizobium sp. BT-229]MCV9964380.1 CYTH domain-containing protein [Pararhizobium sp. BT-229]